MKAGSSLDPQASANSPARERAGARVREDREDAFGIQGVDSAPTDIIDMIRIRTSTHPRCIACRTVPDLVNCEASSSPNLRLSTLGFRLPIRFMPCNRLD